MTINKEDLYAYVAGLADASTVARIDQEVQEDPDGPTARDLRRLTANLANPWDIDWGGIMSALEDEEEDAEVEQVSLERAEDAEAEQASLELASERIRGELELLAEEVESGRWPRLLLDDHRGLINEVRGRLDVAGFAVSPQRYYPAAAEALRRLKVERAQRQLARGNPDPEKPVVPSDLPETLRDTERSAPSSDTLLSAVVNPARVLDTENRFLELGQVDASLQEVFLLAHFGGRSVEEIARLGNLPLSSVQETLSMALAYIEGPQS
jgi:hypothetical protein